MDLDQNTADIWADALKALAHPTRLQIVGALLEGTRCVTDMQDILPARQANVSQHLAVLRYARLVDFNQSGSQRCYHLRHPELIKGILQQLSLSLAQPGASKNNY